MKALWYEKTGRAQDVLIYGEYAKPVPAKGEVLLRIHASGVNPSDVKARAGLRGGSSAMPYPQVIPHSDGAGVIEALGEDVPSKLLGQRVWVWNAQWKRAYGSAAEYLAIPVNQVVPLPDSVSYEVGAALGIPAVTACHCVFCDGEVEGQTLLISGGAGSVGNLAIQFAKLGGAFVITTARGKEGIERAYQAGADEVIDFSTENLAEKIIAANSGRLIDRIIEVEFGINANLDAEVIRERGRIVAYGSAKLLKPELPFYPLMFKGVNLEMVLIYLLSKAEHQQVATRINQALIDQKINIPIHKTFTLADCAKAHECVESGQRTGAVIINV